MAEPHEKNVNAGKWLRRADGKCGKNEKIIRNSM